MTDSEQKVFLAIGANGTAQDAAGESQGSVMRFVVEPKLSQVNPASGQTNYTKGHTIEFHGGRFITSDPKEIEFLRASEQNGAMFIEQGNEPGRPKPELEDVIAEIADATLTLDVPAIVKRRDAELDTYGRATVLTICNTALEKLAEHGDEDARDAIAPKQEDAETVAAT